MFLRGLFNSEQTVEEAVNSGMERRENDLFRWQMAVKMGF